MPTSTNSEFAPPIPIVKPGTMAFSIRFVSEPPAGSRVLRRFIDPRRAIAIVDDSNICDLSAGQTSSATLEQLEVLTTANLPDGDSAATTLLKVNDEVDALLPVAVPFGRGRIYWRPGLALLEDVDQSDEILVVLAEFAFYEAELRRLEAAVRPCESSAVHDVANVYRMTSKSQSYWDRFGKTMESLAMLRLTFSRLEPRLLTASRDIAPRMTRLFSATLPSCGSRRSPLGAERPP